MVTRVQHAHIQLDAFHQDDRGSSEGFYLPREHTFVLIGLPGLLQPCRLHSKLIHSFAVLKVTKAAFGPSFDGTFILKESASGLIKVKGSICYIV